MYAGLYTGLGRPETQQLNQQCSITIQSASEADDGDWTCQIHVKGNTLQANTKAILTGKHLVGIGSEVA